MKTVINANDVIKMKLITLVENTCSNTACIAEHGLSIYITIMISRIMF